jgi:exodeoxyribonuclease VII small subunit
MVARKAKEKGQSFEAQLARLSELTEKLEAGDLPLEEALGAYEEGIRISRALITQLEAAEKRIEILSRKGGDLRAEPLGDDTGGESGTDDDA